MCLGKGGPFKRKGTASGEVDGYVRRSELFGGGVSPEKRRQSQDREHLRIRCVSRGTSGLYLREKQKDFMWK